MPGDLHVNVALGSHLPSRRRSDLHNSKKVYDYLRQNYPRRVLSWVHDAQWQGPQDVSLDDIDMARRPGGRDDKKVRGIADGIRQGKPMEPVVLVKTPSNDKYEIADGYHRTLAFKHAGKKKLKAHVGIVTTDNGPWERAMHAAKINKRNFNPLEPRDHHGRWILSGLLSDMERVGEHKSSKPHVHRRRRASSRVVVSEVKRLELPGRARPDRVSEAEDYIRQNVPVD